MTAQCSMGSGDMFVRLPGLTLISRVIFLALSILWIIFKEEGSSGLILSVLLIQDVFRVHTSIWMLSSTQNHVAIPTGMYLGGHSEV